MSVLTDANPPPTPTFTVGQEPVSGLATGASPKLRRFSADEYHRMGETGILAPRERVELLDGVIYQMSPIGPLHNDAADNVAAIFQDLRGRPPRWRVRTGGSVALLDHSEPMPDVALLRPVPYRTALPGPADILLLIEIADASLAYDRDVKAPRYAQAGIPEYWILNLSENLVEVYRRSDRGVGPYAPPRRAAVGEVLSPAAFPDVSVAVADLLGAIGLPPTP